MIAMRQLQQGRQECCDDRLDGWCRTCGGHAHRPHLGVARTAGELEAEEVYQRRRARGQALEACPISLAWMARRIAPLLSVVDDVEVRKWLVEEGWKAAGKRWREMVENYSGGQPKRM